MKRVNKQDGFICVQEDLGSVCMFIYLCLTFFRYIFNTEGHFLPMSPEISLPGELCNYAGSLCKEHIIGRLGDAKSKLMKELEESRKAEEQSTTGDCNDSDLDSQTCSITPNDRENRGIKEEPPNFERATKRDRLANRSNSIPRGGPGQT